jgi:phosphotransferase system enzyme I (PtsP)
MIMAGTGSADDRLQSIVRLIANNMVSEVCSVYFIRGGDILELFATEGLLIEAIHKTRLKIGEGLVGYIALSGRPHAFADAQEHPKFAFRPETGEQDYHSMLGVPIMRAGKVVGVIAVQNKTKRHYTAEEVEALQTVAMVVAEFVASGDLFDPLERQEATLERAATTRFEGQVFAEGLAEGIAVLHEPKIEVLRHLSKNPNKQKRRLTKGIEDLIIQIDKIMSAEDLKHHGEHSEILDVYKLFAKDKGWKRKIETAIESGLTAEAAVEKIQTDNRNRMLSTDDPYMRERLHDLDDLANRLNRHLMGKAGTAASAVLPDNTILLAQNMGPAELLEYDRSKLKAVILKEGSLLAHVAIVARALGITMVGQVEGAIDNVEEGEQVIVNGLEGTVYLSPLPEILQGYQENIAERSELLASYDALKDKRAITKDGVEIDLFMNAGLAIDMESLEKRGAKGVGLFRTEFQFMVSDSLPRVKLQAEFYGAILDDAGDKPVTFRTLDIGGDKPVSFLKREEEANPALGWRAIRISFDRPALLRYQIRALLIAAAGRELNIMFPMIATVSEFIMAKKILQKEIDRHSKAGRALPQEIKVGTMLEVPSLVWQLDQLLPLVDFVSVGSNDLMQFFYASDRENPKLNGRYDILSAPALSMLKFIAEKCDHYNVPVTLCGEAGGKAITALTLMAIGFRRLSISAASIGPVKMAIRSLNLDKLERYIDSLLSHSDHSLRIRIQNYMQDHKIEF